MNPDAECDCCPPTTCKSCSPQTSSARLIRTERPFKEGVVCSTKNCNIFGGHDINPTPLSDYQCRMKRNKTRIENQKSLGSPIGVAVSNVNFKTEFKTNDIVQARYATYLKAFACLYLNDERSWNSSLIDDIMKEGLILYTASQKEENNLESPEDVYMPNEVKILREFELSGFKFHIELMSPFKLNNSALSETGAKGDGIELALDDIATALKTFLRQRKYVLITVDSFYALIWRSNEAYFVFDVCGRRLDDFQSDKDKGVAMLICLNSLDNVRHLIANLSSLQERDPVVIREIKMVKVVTPEGNIVQRDYGARTHQYQVVNDDYAYLLSSLHLTLNRRDLLRNRSALPVAVTAIVVSKIDHPATWDIKMVDKIICFGVNFCQACWVKCTDRELVDVNEFPTYFTMGQFQITIEIIAHKYKGTWRCVPSFKHSELGHAFKKAFDTGDQKLLMQINYQMYAIWKKHDFIYLLDPYRHRILGKEGESEVYEQMQKSATVRMFRSFDVFMNVFNHILLDSNRTSPFFIHTVKVKNIQTRFRPKADSTVPIEDTKLDAYGEIISLNEHICFEEAKNLCQKALGEVSDYEDEDLKSDVDEIELRTSSSEEDLLEEEEAGMGEVEEMEGLESSSSGEEGGGHKRKTAARRVGGKGNKAGSKGTGKGDKSKDGSKKGKKGQGTKDNEGRDHKRKKGEKKESGESSENEEMPSKTKMSKGLKQKDDEATNKKNKQKSKSFKEKDDEATNKKNKQSSKGEDQKERENKENEIKDLKIKPSKVEHNQEDGDEAQKLKNKHLKDLNENYENKKNQTKLTDKVNDDDNIDDKKAINNNKKLKGKSTVEKDRGKNEHEKGNTNFTVNEQLDGDINKDANKNVPKKDKKLKNLDPEKNSDKDKHKDLVKARDDTVDLNLSKDQDENEPQLDKPKKKDEKGFKAIKSYSNFEIKNIDDEKITKRIDKPLEENDKQGQSEAKIHHHEPSTDQVNGSDKENEGNYRNKITEKDLNKVKKNIDNDKEIDEKHKPKNNLDENNRPDNKKRTLYDPNRAKGKKGSTVRSQLYDDGTEADDENEDFFNTKQRYCSIPNPNRYPGYFKQPADMAVVGSETGSYESICKLFQAGFKVADRLLIMTPWGNFVIFRCSNKTGLKEKHYFLFDGCTCNFNRFRHLDLSVGTAGLICFKHIHNVIEYIRHLRKSRKKNRNEQKYNVDDICHQYCNRHCNLRI